MFPSFWGAVVYPVRQKMAERKESLYNNLGYPDKNARRESNNIIVYNRRNDGLLSYLCTFLIYSVSSSWALILIPIAASVSITIV